eukprot:2408541-Pyramimonas_sp.AAC.1
MDGTTAQFAKTSQSFSIHFKDEDTAKKFKACFIQQQLQWEDARDGSCHDLRIRTDLPDDARHRQRRMSHLWAPVVQLLETKSKYQADCKIGANGFRN